MIRLLVPIIFLGISVAGFFVFTNPLYHEISALRGDKASYDEALSNSKALEDERDKLTQKYNNINPADLEKIQKLLPASVDNIRLILEIEKIAVPHGMALRDVKYDDLPKETETPNGGVVQFVDENYSTNRNYGTWNLEFSTEGTYNNLVNFLRDLEKNLRIVDISSISFSSDTGTDTNLSLSQVYKYTIKLKTYWLKN